MLTSFISIKTLYDVIGNNCIRFQKSSNLWWPEHSIKSGFGNLEQNNFSCLPNIIHIKIYEWDQLARPSLPLSKSQILHLWWRHPKESLQQTPLTKRCDNSVQNDSRCRARILNDLCVALFNAYFNTLDHLLQSWNRYISVPKNQGNF